MKRTLLRRQNLWLLPVLGGYAIVYACSLSFVYVDGDDATAIAYHLLGRDSVLQPAYSPYQGMMDRLLALLPANEPLLRTAAFSVTAIATPLMLVLMLMLVFRWMGDPPPVVRLGIALAVLLASPELFYLGLIYTPSSIGMFLMLGAHLLLLRNLDVTHGPPRSLPDSARLFLAPAVLFGLGGSFRWNLIAYGLVVGADIARRGPAGRFQWWRPAVTWGTLAAASTIGAVLISGYGPRDAWDKLASAEAVMKMTGLESQGSVTVNAQTVATLLSLVTPGALVLAVVGLVVLLQRRDSLLLPIIAALVGVLPWLPSGVPKFMLSAVPALMLCMGTGLWAIGTWQKKPAVGYGLRAAVLLILVVPWFLGVRIAMEGKAWGPGFEIRRFDAAQDAVGFSLVPIAGAALPTPEGPRPLMGHAYALLGGEWRRYVRRNAADRADVLTHSLAEGVPVLYASWSPDFLTTDAIARGFLTQDSADRPLPADGFFTERRFERDDGISMVFLYREVLGPGTEQEIRAFAGLHRASAYVYLRASPGFLRTLRSVAPDALLGLGPTTAVLRLDRLAAAVKGDTARPLE